VPERFKEFFETDRGVVETENSQNRRMKPEQF
jgi:hypothetical protein